MKNNKKMSIYFALLICCATLSVFAVPEPVLGVSGTDFKELTKAMGFGEDTNSLKTILEDTVFVKPALEAAGFTQEQLAQGLNLFLNRFPNFPKRFGELEQAMTVPGKKSTRIAGIVKACLPKDLTDPANAVCKTKDYCNGDTKLACIKAGFAIVVQTLLPFITQEITGKDSMPYQALGLLPAKLREAAKDPQAQFNKYVTIPTDKFVEILTNINKVLQAIPVN
jgi:hypothetical protein